MAHAGEIAAELRLKEVRFEQDVLQRMRLKPNLRLLGPRLGRDLPAVRAVLEAGRYELLDTGAVAVAGMILGPNEVLRERRPVNEGWAVATQGDLSVEIDTQLDDELVVEGRVLDLIRQLNDLRKRAELELTDRVAVWIPDSDADLLAHADWISAEVLATRIATEPGTATPRIERTFVV